MVRDGFDVSGFDGKAYHGGPWNTLSRPFDLNGVRADAWGFRADDQVIALAEAKTLLDIDTAHTRHQLNVLGRVRMRVRRTRCPIYVAIPRSGAYALDRVLIDIGLIGSKNLYRVHVPDVLLEDSSNATVTLYPTIFEAPSRGHEIPARQRARRAVR
jgi:hypothetical protein